VSYLFVEESTLYRLCELVERTGADSPLDLSVPASAPLHLEGPALYRELTRRIARATHVVVIVSDGLHLSPIVEYEVAEARRLSKPVIVQYQNGDFGSPIPGFLDDCLYRAVGWRTASLEKALAGEYPQDSRIFDIAEAAERRRLATWIAGAAAGASALLAWHDDARLARLRAELRDRGVHLARATSPWPSTIGSAFIGALGALLVHQMIGGHASPVPLVVLGALGAGAAGFRAHTLAELHELGPLLRLTVKPA